MAGKRILLLAATTGYQTQMFAHAADRIGYELVLATDRCHVLDDPWGDRALPIRFNDPYGAADAAGQIPALQGIVALGDRPAEVAAVIAARLGIRYNSPVSAAASRNKFEARKRFQSEGLLVPRFSRIGLTQDTGQFAIHQSYPCVLKPTGLSGSRGVMRANNPEQFIAAFRRIEALLRDPDIDDREYIQVEEFIPGAEFALEGLVTDGRLRVLALFDKPDPLDGPFFEETIYVTPSRQSDTVQRAISETAQSAVRALGLTHGPVHAEMRVNHRGVWMLEVAPRPIGGLCAQVLPGLPELILRHACGEDVTKLNVSDRAAGVMMIPIPSAGIYQQVSGLPEACDTPGIEDIVITAKQGQNLIPLPEGKSYLGFIFARGEDPQQVEQAIRKAHSKLDFSILAALPVLQPN
jgi:biotin carboxylase